MSSQSTAEKNKALVASMYEAINDHRVGKEYWTEDMVWRGPAGIGTKHGLEQYRREHQQPYLRAFSDKHADDEIRIAEGEYVAAHGYQYATHSGEYLGIPASGMRIKMRYMDFWRVEGDRLAENWVLIDILDFLGQLGYDVEKVLAFIGSKPPEFFEDIETD
jgi:predicted ester cyclase